MAVDKDIDILVVDNYPGIIRDLLKQLGFNNIDEATDGSAALEKIGGKQYGLIISDWNMEPMTGLDLLKEVRGKGDKIPFIMATAESKTENVLAAREAGVNNYIVKPFNVDTLRNKLESVLGNWDRSHSASRHKE